MWKEDTPQAVGLDPKRWEFVLELAEGWCAEDRVPAIGLVVGRQGKTTPVHLFGRQRIGRDSEPIREDAIFLVASITKPVVATGILLLVERCLVALGDRVTEYIPEFAGKGRNAITIRHLLTHTSGLPDMLPENIELRRANAPLSAFVEGTCRVEPDFPPGRGVQYQSMGFALLGEIIGRVTGRTCAEFLREELFGPLEMQQTELGAPQAWFEGANPKIDRVAEIRLPEGQSSGDSWHWNSRYWRSLGAPWGGLLTTPGDLGRFARMMLNRGTFDGRQILSRASTCAATRNQLVSLKDVPEADRRCRPWGLGWRLNWPAQTANFGDLPGPKTYGHWGATGTVMWIDPERESWAVVLTTQPQEPEGFYLARISNAIAAAFV